MKHQGIPGPIQEAEMGITALDLFQRFQTRAEYEEQFGVPPPDYVEAWGDKMWLDPNAEASKLKQIPYEGLGDDGERFVFTVAKPLAGRVNIPPEIRPVEDRYGMPLIPMPVRKLVPPEVIIHQDNPHAPFLLRNTELWEAQREKDPFARMEKKLDQIIQLLSKPRAMAVDEMDLNAVKPADVGEWADVASKLLPLFLALVEALKKRKA